jgi:hypothetical protein
MGIFCYRLIYKSLAAFPLSHNRKTFQIVLFALVLNYRYSEDCLPSADFSLRSK